jgi:cytochrome P450
MTATITKLKDPLRPVTREFLQNPYPYYHKLREESPLFWSEDGHYWLVTSYDYANTILRDMRFGKRVQDWKYDHIIRKFARKLMPTNAFSTSSMLNQDPPNHTRLRALVNKAFTPKMVEGMKVNVQSIADELLDKVMAQGKMDIVQDYSFPLPVTVIAEMLGIPASDREQFKQWSDDITNVLEPTLEIGPLFQAWKAQKALVEYLTPLVEKRRKQPMPDLISALLSAEEKGDRLTTGELFSNIILLLVAGHETTVNLIGNGIIALLKHPDQLQLLKEKPELIGSCVDEVLRYDSSVQMVRRLAMEDVEIDGKVIHQGDMVIILLGAANRDPKRFADPDKFDIQRSDNKYVSFGFGIHHCLGSALAPAEAHIAISSIFQRLPNLKSSLPLDQLVYKTPFSLRGVETLPITF